MMFRQAIKKLMGFALPRERFLLKGDPNCGPAQPDDGLIPISLTFDDGPDPDWTLPVLDALDEAGWTGTFFLVGREAAAHPRLVREIVARGHEIGNHSYAHREPDQIGARAFASGVVRTQRLLSAMTGKTVTLMRPPKGKLNILKSFALWRRGQSVILWNVDPRDYQMAEIEDARDWARGYQPAAGDIVLLHDRFRYAAEIVRTLAKQSSSRVRSVPVSAWLERSPATERQDTEQLPGKLINS